MGNSIENPGDDNLGQEEIEQEPRDISQIPLSQGTTLPKLPDKIEIVAGKMDAVRQRLGLELKALGNEGVLETEIKVEYGLVTIEKIPEVLAIQEATWLDTYAADPKFGITRDDVFSKRLQSQPRVEKMEKALDSGQTYFATATVDGKMIGFSEGKREESYNVLVNLHIMPGFQGKKIGSKLLSQVLGWLGDEKPIILNVAEGNDRAIHVYEKLGFVKNPNPTKTTFAKFESGRTMPNHQMIRLLKPLSPNPPVASVEGK